MTHYTNNRMEIGTKLANRYEIVGELGRGGMGVVYRARDPLLDREVAVKLVTPDLLTPEVEVRFLREAQVVAKMDHPAIVTVHDIGRHEGSLFFVMPVVHGLTLRRLIDERSLSLRDAVAVCAQVASALDYSHELGVVHRDMKPENVIVARDGDRGVRARIMDFGLALVSYESQITRITRAGTLLGTVSYLSPEQVTGGGELDGRSDVYSLGSILYECFVGKPPFSGDMRSVLYRIAHETPEAPARRGATVDADLETLVMRCLAKSPADRPQHAREVADALALAAVRLSDAPAIAVGAPASRAEAAPARETATLPFVGRAAELAEVADRVERAARGECQLVLVAGESGSGKTRLLEELEAIARRRGVRVLHGRMLGEDREFPFQIYFDAIREFFTARDASAPPKADLDEVAADLVRLFPALAEITAIRDAAAVSAAAEPSGPLADRDAIFDVIARTLARLADVAPILFELEDIHRGTVSVEALAYLARRLGASRVAFVGTYLASELDRRHAVSRLADAFAGDRRFATIRLGPLDAGAHREVVEALLGGRRVSDSTARRLYEATEGNPLFTRELVLSLVDLGEISESVAGSLHLSAEIGLSADALPVTIQQAVERRVESLPDDLREVLVVAAVLGREFDFDELEAMVDAPVALDEAVDRLARRGLLVERAAGRRDRLAFSSRIVRDVLYGTSPRRRRRSLHRRFAALLEDRHASRLDRVVHQLAHHYAHGDVPEKAVEFGLKAAARSLEAFSFEDAERTLKVAVEFFGAEWEGDRAAEGEARLMLGRVYRQQGAFESALAEARRACRIFETARMANRAAAAMALAAETAFTARRMDDTNYWVGRGLAAARAAGCDAELAELLSIGVLVANLGGDYDAARALTDELEAIRSGARAAPRVKSAAAPLRGGRIRVPIGAESPFDRIDPMRVGTDQQADIFANVFETLTRVVDGARVVPWLAAEIRPDEGGRTFRFRLRDGVRFHDGRPLAAADVRHSFERVLRSPESRGHPIVTAIVGAGDAARDPSRRLAGFRIESDREFTVELERPIAFFPVLLTDPSMGVVPEGADDLAGTWREGCVGTGPFRVVGFEPERRVALARNPDYWREGVPRCDELEFLLNVPYGEILDEFRAGHFAIASGLLSSDVEALRLASDFGPTFRDSPSLSTAFVALNVRRGPLASLETRRRVARALDAPTIVRRTLMRLTTPATTLTPPSLLGLDVARALSLDGSRHDAEPDATLTAVVSPAFTGRLAPVRDEVYAALRAVGFEVRDVGVWTSDAKDVHRTGEVDLILTMWAADYPDADNFAYGLLHTSEGVLGAFCGSREIDRLSEAARSEADPMARHALYRQVEDVVAREALVVPLFHPQKYRFGRPELQGLAVSSVSFPIVPYEELWFRR
jgi:ABC-type transport system substrate-binding protein